MNASTIASYRVLEVPDSGAAIGTEREALDLMGEAYGQEIDLIVVPASRLHPDFLKLSTGMAGAFLQKMQNYGFRVAVLGDIGASVAASTALHDFVYESNKVGRMLFVADRKELERRLNQQREPAAR
jgi:hypothetical protein